VAYNRTQVQNVIDALNRAQALDAKTLVAAQTLKIGVDDNDDFSVTNAAQVTAYVTTKRALRDSLVIQMQPIVAAWT